MRYQGGKSRISKDIEREISNAVYGWGKQDKQPNSKCNINGTWGGIF